MSITKDQALVREANNQRRAAKAQLMDEISKARHPDALDMLWHQHPEAPYTIYDDDGGFVCSTWPDEPWPERGQYGRGYQVAAEALAAHVVAVHNAGLGEEEDSEPEIVDAWGETSYGGTLS